MENPSPVGWLSLLPPLLTIVLAIATRRVVVSLLCGIAIAIVILLPGPSILADAESGTASDESFSWWNYLGESLAQFVYQLTEEHLWSALVDPDHLRVFAFTTLLGMQVALIHRSGGMEGIVCWATPLARSRRGGQVLTWILGLIIFIDDYANTLLLGSTMRPLTDRLRISREKLAFLVDSTAAPVSGLALVSTWVATEISAMQAGYQAAGIDIGSETFGIFIQTIPSRFYILYALVFVLLCGWLCRDFGPMFKAEQRAWGQGPDDTPASIPGNRESLASRPRAMNAILPIVVTVVVAVWLLVVTGRANVGDAELSASAWRAAGQIIGQGDSYLALVYASLAGLGLILLMIAWQRRLDVDQVREGLMSGFTHVLPALVILWLAWTLSGLTGEGYLETGQFLAWKISAMELHPGWMPTIIFLIAAITAFSTGTSWGTMAILMPIAIPLVHQLLQRQGAGAVEPDHFILLATIGSVLAGAIFGDHCSPISDTTILSSRSSDCDHIAHVRTQMPYAVTVGSVAIMLGTLPAGFGVSSWLLIPAAIVVLVLILLSVGKRVETAADIDH